MSKSWLRIVHRDWSSEVAGTVLVIELARRNLVYHDRGLEDGDPGLTCRGRAPRFVLLAERVRVVGIFPW